MKPDFLVVGAGLTGATIARLLTDARKRVLVVDRRHEVAGNVFDYNSNGIWVHKYGPHYFRTSDPQLWKFVNQFAEFHDYNAIVKTYVDERYENWPISRSYVRRRAGDYWTPEFRGIPRNFEEAALSCMPKCVYEDLVKPYTEKQWGVPATQLDAELCSRFSIREDNDPRLHTYQYQGIPVGGYTKMVEEMLRGIDVELNYDYLIERPDVKHVVFTGSIDEYYGFKLGKLKYRGQLREHRHISNYGYVYPVGQINVPLRGAMHIRMLEWKHMMPFSDLNNIDHTVITTESPYTPDDPDGYEYPFPDSENRRLYEEYRRIDSSKNVTFCGRLGEYRYMDMNTAINRAMKTASDLIHGT